MDITVFDPPEDYSDAFMSFWPTLKDQREFVSRRQAQIGRVLSVYRGHERDYEELKRESDLLFAVHHTLCGVLQLCDNHRVRTELPPQPIMKGLSDEK